MVLIKTGASCSSSGVYIISGHMNVDESVGCSFWLLRKFSSTVHVYLFSRNQQKCMNFARNLVLLLYSQSNGCFLTLVTISCSIAKIQCIPRSAKSPCTSQEFYSCQNLWQMSFRVNFIKCACFQHAIRSYICIFCLKQL